MKEHSLVLKNLVKKFYFCAPLLILNRFIVKDLSCNLKRISFSIFYKLMDCRTYYLPINNFYNFFIINLFNYQNNFFYN